MCVTEHYRELQSLVLIINMSKHQFLYIGDNTKGVCVCVCVCACVCKRGWLDTHTLLAALCSTHHLITPQHHPHPDQSHPPTHTHTHTHTHPHTPTHTHPHTHTHTHTQGCMRTHTTTHQVSVVCHTVVGILMVFSFL